jgi:AsmA protein
MRKNPVLAWIIGILGTLAAVAALGLGALVYLVSRIDAAAEIERVVEQATGRDLTISGKAGLSLWPIIGIEAEDAALANVEGGRAPALMAADEINIGMEIMPLFRRQVVVRELVLEHPRIALEVDAQGRPNWLLQRRPTLTQGPQAPAGSSSIDLTPRTFSLRSVRISDGEFSYYDGRRGAGWVFGDADLTTAFEGPEQPVRVAGAIRYNDRPVELLIELAKPGAALRGELTQFSLQMHGELLNLSFAGQTVAASGEMAGNVRAEGPNLRALTAWVGVPIQGGAGLQRFAVDGRLALGGGAYDFSNASFTLDAISGRGDFILSESRGKPYLSGRLELFDLDLNPYLAGAAPPAPVQTPTSEAPAAPTPPAPAAEAPRAIDVQSRTLGQTPIDFSGLRAINADLELTTHALTFQHIQLDSSRMGVVLHDGYMAATLHTAALYGGYASGRLEFDARTPRVRLVQDISLSGVDTQRFLTDAVNFSNIAGRGDLAYTIETQGLTQRELIESARGRAHIEVVSGTLRGVDLGGVASTIRTALRGELIAPEAQTPFQGMSGTFAIAGGALASDSLSFNTPQLRIPGIGVIDLVRSRIDMRMAPRSPRGGIVVPFAARGPLGQVAYTSDIRDRALREIQARVNEVEAAARAPQ